jgi:hypothetical protein
VNSASARRTMITHRAKLRSFSFIRVRHDRALSPPLGQPEATLAR